MLALASSAAAGSVSGVTFTADSYLADTPVATWTIGFTTSGSGALTTGNSVAVRFPAGFDVTHAVAAFGTGFSGCALPAAVITGQVVFVPLTGSSCSIAADTAATVLITGVFSPFDQYANSGFSVGSYADATFTTPLDTAARPSGIGGIKILAGVAYMPATSAGTPVTSGTPPVDPGSPYDASTSTVTVLDNTGSLALPGYTFAGWCDAPIAADPTQCSGTHYDAGDSITLTAGTSSNVALFSQWAAAGAGAAADGSGVSSVSPASATAGSSATLAFTYTAATGGVSGGEVDVAVPSGWSAPTGSAAAGCTTASAGTLSFLGRTIVVSGVTLAGGGTLTVTYGATSGGSCTSGDGATVQGSAGVASFATSERSTAGGSLTALAASPTVTVAAPPPPTCNEGYVLMRGVCIRWAAGYVNGVPCAPGTYAASAGATACTPAPPGSYVSSVGATSATPCKSGTYSDSPGATACVVRLTVTGASPSRGAAGTATTVTLSGTGFTSAATVRWSQGSASGGSCGVEAVDDTALTCTLPGGAPAGDELAFTVSDAGQSATSPPGHGFTPVAVPRIISVTSGSSRAKTPQTVTLAGTDLGRVHADVDSITYGANGLGKTCTTPNWISSTMLTCVVGGELGAGSKVAFVVSVLGIVSAPSTATYSVTAALPRIVAVSPDGVPGGPIVPGETKRIDVTLAEPTTDREPKRLSGGICADTPVNISPTVISCTLNPPAAGAKTVEFTVSTAAGTSDPSVVDVVRKPVITDVEPSTTPRGRAVRLTVNGTGLTTKMSFVAGSDTLTPSSCTGDGTGVVCTVDLSKLASGSTIFAKDAGSVSTAGVTLTAMVCGTGWVGPDCTTPYPQRVTATGTVTRGHTTVSDGMASLSGKGSFAQAVPASLTSTPSITGRGLSLASRRRIAANGVVAERGVRWKPALTPLRPLRLTFHDQAIRAGDTILTHTRAGWKPLGVATKSGVASVDVTRQGAYAVVRARRARGYTLVGAHGPLQALGASIEPPAGATRGVVAASADLGGRGGVVTDARGRVTTWGSVAERGSLRAALAHDRVVGVAVLPDGSGYFLATARGRVFAFGKARAIGSLARRRSIPAIAAIVLSTDGRGYQLVSRSGSVYSFGDAPSVPPSFRALKTPVVAAARIAGGLGLLLVDARGRVTTRGAAGFYGDLSKLKLDARIVGIVPSATGKGYVLVNAHGAGIAFGDAVALQPASPLSGVLAVG